MKDLVLDETLTESEVNELRQLTVDLRSHPNRVFLRSLAHIGKGLERS